MSDEQIGVEGIKEDEEEKEINWYVDKPRFEMFLRLAEKIDEAMEMKNNEEMWKMVEPGYKRYFKRAAELLPLLKKRIEKLAKDPDKVTNEHIFESIKYIYKKIRKSGTNEAMDYGIEFLQELMPGMACEKDVTLATLHEVDMAAYGDPTYAFDFVMIKTEERIRNRMEKNKVSEDEPLWIDKDLVQHVLKNWEY